MTPTNGTLWRPVGVTTCTESANQPHYCLQKLVDSEEKINSFLPVLQEMMTSGLVTLEKVKVFQYGQKAGQKD